VGLSRIHTLRGEQKSLSSSIRSSGYNEEITPGPIVLFSGLEGEYIEVQDLEGVEPMARQPGAHSYDLRSHALTLKAAMAAAQGEIGAALGQMRRKVEGATRGGGNDAGSLTRSNHHGRGRSSAAARPQQTRQIGGISRISYEGAASSGDLPRGGARAAEAFGLGSVT